VHVTSVPYGVNKAQLVERIAEVVVGRKLPALLDVKDISADDVRIELELKADADERNQFSPDHEAIHTIASGICAMILGITSAGLFGGRR